MFLSQFTRLLIANAVTISVDVVIITFIFQRCYPIQKVVSPKQVPWWVLSQEEVHPTSATPSIQPTFYRRVHTLLLTKSARLLDQNRIATIF